MKFGKTLLKSQITEWQSHYISYKALKKTIKSVEKSKLTTRTIDDDPVTAFLFALDRELEKVESFFARKLNDLKKQREKYRYVQSHDHDSNSEALVALTETMNLIHNLLSFADTNKKGFAKILKKFDKKFHQSTQDTYLRTKVAVCSFANDTVLAEILESIEKSQDLLRQVAEQENSEYPPRQNVKLTAERNNIFLDVLEQDDVDALKQIIENMSVGVDEQKAATDKTLFSMLSKACQQRALKCIRLLIESGVNLTDDNDINERSILHKLVIHGGILNTGRVSPTMKNTITSDQLLSLSRSPTDNNIKNMANGDSGSFASDAVQGNPEIISVILEHLKGDLALQSNTKDTSGRRPLHYAMANGYVKIVRVLLEHLINTEQFSFHQDDAWFDNDGYTPLFYGILHGRTQAVKCMIDMGGITDISTITTRSPNHAVYTPLNPFARNEAHTPLAMSCKLGYTAMTELLLDYGADPDSEDKYGETPLHFAVRNGYTECVTLLVGFENEKGVNEIVRKKANMEIKEKLCGRTALLLAAIEGHLEIVDILIKAGANKDATDFSEWTAHVHATFRGHVKVQELLRPSKPYAVKAPEGMETNKESVAAERIYGHKFLQGQSMISVTIGTFDTRKHIKPVQINNMAVPPNSIIPSMSTSLIVSAKNAVGEPTVIDLPVKDHSEPVIFYSDNIDDVTLNFDLVPTYGTKKQLIGRATALLSSIKTFDIDKTSFMGSVTVPILGAGSLEVIGKIIFEFLVVNPYTHPNLSVDSKHTYWKSLTTKLIGHRGMGMNRPSHNLQLGENTVMSFVTAASLGAEYVEFDVQLTKDRVPVIYHDWTITETGYDIPIHAITLGQFLSLKNDSVSQTANGNGTDDDAITITPSEDKATNEKTGTNNNKDTTHITKKLRRSNSLGVMTVKNGLKSAHNMEIKGNGANTIQAPFTTLDETFKKVPLHIGFNIEVKYPMIDEAESSGLPIYNTELNVFVDAILNVVYDHTAQNRNILFSSFHPEICQILAVKQPNYPVFFLSNIGTVNMADARCQSIQRAIRFAKSADLLGIVVRSDPVLEAPQLIKTTKETGLLVFTYGARNNDVECAKFQKKLGVDAVIVDSVLAIRNGLQQHND
ncbi:3742_t:CDS:10 [Paraglomus brasilianum]|uniref:3742_t:CDS:1 n=1 Tax=Paraglomus brasilianum TaxID=144538 RepID=A0A9N9FYJ3_9GLOM|nr:3742_t:CDS:10 [Paraglomus brasilianum]